MTTYYVRGQNGNDGNAGTSFGAAFKTLNALSVMANGDTAILYEDIRSHNTTSGASITFTSKSNLTIRAILSTDGQGLLPTATGRITPATIWGDIVVPPGSWTAAGGGLYTATVNATITGMACNYTFGGSSHAYGHLDRYTDVAAVTAAKGANSGKGAFCQVGTTVTAYFAGADPTSASNVVTYAACSGTVAAIKFAGCSNCSVLGLTFANYPVAELAQFGWGVMVNGGTGNLVGECWAYDLGNHHFGSLGANGDSSSLTIRNCLMAGGNAKATFGISNQNAADGSLSGHLYVGCGFRASRYRGMDGNVVLKRGDTTTTTAISANTQVMVYGHGDSGTIIAAGGIVLRRCTFVNTEGTGAAVSAAGAPKPFAIDNATAVTNGNRWTPSAFPMLVDTCSVVDFIGEQKDVNTGHIYVRDTAYETTITPAAADAVYTGSFLGFGARGLLFAYATSSANNFFHTFDCCTFKAPMTGAICRMFSGGGTATGTSRMSFVNCSFYDSSGAPTNAAWVDYGTTGYPFFEFKGCMFSHSVKSGTSRVCLWDNSNPTVGNFTDCSYYNHDEYSHSGQGSYPTAANWFANVDTVGSVGTNVLGAQPYITPSVNLALTATAKALTRTTSTVVPSSTGINGLAYVGNFGAFQYPASIATLLAPSGPRLGALIICNDQVGFAGTGGVSATVFNNLEGFLASTQSTSWDSLRTEGVVNFCMLWVYGQGSYDIGSCPSGYPGGAVTLTSSPLNQVNHAAAAGTSYLNQIIPAISSRMANAQSVIFYGGCVASSSATDNTTLDSHSSIPEALGAQIAYDAQSLLDYTTGANPHKMHVDRLFSARSVKTIGEAWERSDVSALAGWLSRQTAVMADPTRVALAMGTNYTSADVATWNSVLTYRPLGLRSQMIIQNNGPTVQARLDTTRRAFAAGMDVFIDFDAGWTAENRRSARAFHRRIGLKYRERRGRERATR